jgi:hypothetical protein
LDRRLLPAGIHGVNIAASAAVRSACQLPVRRFPRRPDQCLQTRCQLRASRSPIPGTAFRSPWKIAPLGASSRGSTFPACPFGSPTRFLTARSALRLSRRSRFAPVPAASTPQTRCRPPTNRRRPCRKLPLPLGAFTPLGINASASVQPADPPTGRARFPFAPRCRDR